MILNWHFSIATFTILVAASACRAEADDLAPHLTTILAVGKEGRGHREAATAWKKLAQADAAALPAVLAALDDANPLAANWLRCAAETIADRHLSRGQKLPADELEKFLLDVRHNPRVRRLALELLTKADRTAPDRLIPGMLDDPGTEFRRDAVQRLLDQAAQLNEAGSSFAATGDAVSIYLKALSGAREQDQTETIVRALDRLGHPVDLPEHFGLIIDWHVIGPFDNSGNKGFERSYAPELKIDLDARYAGKTADVSWAPCCANAKYAVVDLVKAIGPGDGTAAYGVTEFAVGTERPVELRLTTSNAWKLWVNGQLISQCDEYHRHMEPDRDETKTFMKPQFDQYRLKTELKKGNNTILVKICQNEQNLDWAQRWQFQLRVCDEVGKAILSKTRRNTAVNGNEPRRSH